MANVGPIIQSVAGQANPSTTPSITNPGHLGVGGPPTPYMYWDPHGNATGSAIAESAYRQAGSNVSNTPALDSLVTHTKAFKVPPLDGESEKFIMPQMLAFTVDEFDPAEDGTVVWTQVHLNQTMHDAYEDFKVLSNPRETTAHPQAVRFRELLEAYGERALEDYHRLIHQPALLEAWNRRAASSASGAKLQNDLQEFYQMSCQDVFCWQTRFGILRKISYHGPVINVNRAVSGEEMDFTAYTDHYVNVNVALAKRCEVANIWGSSEFVTTGTKLWIVLRRKAVIERGQRIFKEYQIVGVGSKLKDYPVRDDLEYQDPSGRVMDGHRWNVGVVTFPASFSPTPSQIQNATNTGFKVNEREAYSAHAGLPVMWINAGYKH